MVRIRRGISFDNNSVRMAQFNLCETKTFLFFIWNDDVTKATPGLVGQQGGWMATKTQLIRMNNKLCKANFLPPFNDMGSKDKVYNDFGTHNVEFWVSSFDSLTELVEPPQFFTRI